LVGPTINAKNVNNAPLEEVLEIRERPPLNSKTSMVGPRAP
jgi:hypothetical protein